MINLSVKTKEETFSYSNEMRSFIANIKTTEFYKTSVSSLCLVKEDPSALFYVSEKDVTNTARRVAFDVDNPEGFALVDIHYLNIEDNAPAVYTIMEV